MILFNMIFKSVEIMYVIIYFYYLFFHHRPTPKLGFNEARLHEATLNLYTHA